MLLSKQVIGTIRYIQIWTKFLISSSLRSTILALNPGKFDNSADILVLVKSDDLHYTRKIGLTSRYCGPVGYSGIGDHLPVSQHFYDCNIFS